MSIKKFRIVLDGVEHEVEVEELGGVSAPTPVAAAAPAARPAARAAAPKKAAPAPAAGGAGTIAAPLQGKIQDVKVNVGDSVKTGQVVVIIEAMKMENEVVAPADGTVTSVSVKKGDSVNSGDPLVALQ